MDKIHDVILYHCIYVDCDEIHLLGNKLLMCKIMLFFYFWVIQQRKPYHTLHTYESTLSSQ